MGRVALQPRRVNWLLLGDRSLAASRFQGYLIHDYLKSRGVPTRLVSAPPFAVHDVPWPTRALPHVAELLGNEIVVFQALLGPNTELLRRTLELRGATTVYVQCHLIPDNPLPLRCDAIVCTSRYLEGFYRGQGAERVAYIPDPAEFWCDRNDIGDDAQKRKIRLCWMAHRSNIETLVPLRRLLAEPELAGFELVTVSNHPEADIQWSPETARRALEACDIGVVPTRADPRAVAASSNRVAAFMAAGKPVIADRLPSYEEIVDSGRNGYLCDGPDDWRSALLALRDGATRRAVALQAYDDALPHFHLDRIGEQWVDLLASLPHPSNTLAAPSRRREGRLTAYARLHACLGYSRIAIARYYRLRVILGIAARGLFAAPRAPSGLRTLLPFLVGLTPTVALRARDALVRRTRGLLKRSRR